jgi:hypothetical protein
LVESLVYSSPESLDLMCRKTMRVATPGGEYIHKPELTNGEYTRESNKNMNNSMDIYKHLKSSL